MAVSWSAPMDRRLLLVYVALSKTKPTEVAQAWEEMHGHDSTIPQPTARAITEHIGKLRKNIGGVTVADANSSVARFAAPATLARSQASNADSSESTPTKTKQKRRKSFSDVDDDEEQLATPSKKTRKRLNGHGARVKEEPRHSEQDASDTPSPCHRPGPHSRNVNPMRDFPLYDFADLDAHAYKFTPNTQAYNGQTRKSTAHQAYVEDEDEDPDDDCVILSGRSGATFGDRSERHSHVSAGKGKGRAW